jgi:hypothetical protein
VQKKDEKKYKIQKKEEKADDDDNFSALREHNHFI